MHVFLLPGFVGIISSPNTSLTLHFMLLNILLDLSRAYLLLTFLFVVRILVQP